MQTRSMMTLSPNGKQDKQGKYSEEREEKNNNSTKKTVGVLLAEIRKKLDKQTEIHIPKLEKDYAEELITSDELEEGYKRIITDVLELQKQLTQIPKKSTMQEKRIENLSIDFKIKTNDTKDKFERTKKDTKIDKKRTVLQNKSRFLTDATPKAKKMTEDEVRPKVPSKLDVKVLQSSPITNVPKVTTSAPLATSVVFNKKRQSSLSPSSQQRKGLTKRWSTAEQEPTDADTTPYSQYSVVYKIKSKNYGTTAQDIFHELSSGGDTENKVTTSAPLATSVVFNKKRQSERGGDTPISDKQQQGDISMSEQRKNITLLSISSSNEYISRGLIDIGRVQYHIYNIMTGVKKLLPHYQIFLSVYNVLCPHKFQMAGMLA